MKLDLPRVSVVVAEPDGVLRGRMSNLSQKVWPAHEVLPRTTEFEMTNACRHLGADVVIVRASVLKASEDFSASVLQWIAAGGKAICLQDSGLVYKAEGWQRIGNVYYLSIDNPSSTLLELLVSFRIEQIAQGQLSFPS